MDNRPLPPYYHRIAIEMPSSLLLQWDVVYLCIRRLGSAGRNTTPFRTQPQIVHADSAYTICLRVL